MLQDTSDDCNPDSPNTGLTLKINSKHVVWLLGILISIATIAYLVINLDWITILGLVTGLQWGWIIVAVVMYAFSLVFRAYRFKYIYYSKPASIVALLPVVGLHNFFNYILPARSGEFSYILLAKQKLDIPYSEGTATLLAVRIYDFVMIAAILLCVLPFSWMNMPDWVFIASLVFSVTVLLVFAGMLYFVRRWTVGPGYVDRNNALVSRFGSVIRQLSIGLKQIYAHRAHLNIGVFTLGIWLCLYTNFYFTILGLGYSINFFQVVMLSLVMVPLTLLPLQGVANLGTHELAWVSVLLLFGYPEETALAIAVGSHGFLFLLVVLVGGLSFAFSWFSQNRYSEDQ
ncbi:MAG: flippase-like domain-containing protein [Anaerolineales bacterium]|nr:flippase-like domain-containing protein [Anaerolineales bacterium]